MKKQNKGITLIALVITIIVLLILAGVSIATLTGENGILTQAENSKVETGKASKEEAIRLAVMSAITVGNGKIEEDKSFQILNKELKYAGYEGEGIKELPAILIIDKEEYVIKKDGSVSKMKNTIENLKEFGKTITEEKLTLTDKNGHKITIPKNFNISAESPIEVKKGIIIEDSDDNQYVWIPIITKEQEPEWGADFSAVAGEEENTTKYYNAIKKALINTTSGYTKTYRDSKYADVWYGDYSYGKYWYTNSSGNRLYYSNGNMTKDQYANLYNSMLKSVYENGGFYIGRYEMGIDVINNVAEAQAISRTEASKEYITKKENADNEEPTISEMKIPVSKANAVGYNFITQSQAQMLAKKLEQKIDYSNVTSSIMFGVQWDMVCVFLEHYGKIDSNAINNAGESSTLNYLKSNDYSIYWGNYNKATFKLNRGYYTTEYSNDVVTWNENYVNEKRAGDRWLCTTGASNQNSNLNIYDFGGNLIEMTLERSEYMNGPCVSRGGNFTSYGYAAERFANDTYCCFGNFSSRIALCIK